MFPKGLYIITASDVLNCGHRPTHVFASFAPYTIIIALGTVAQKGHSILLFQVMFCKLSLFFIFAQ